MTFTFDEQTVETLRRTSSRMKKPQSVVVREAIQDYAARSHRLSDEERRHMLKVFDRVVARAGIRRMRMPRKRTSARLAELEDDGRVRNDSPGHICTD